MTKETLFDGETSTDILESEKLRDAIRSSLEKHTQYGVTNITSTLPTKDYGGGSYMAIIGRCGGYTSPTIDLVGDGLLVFSTNKKPRVLFILSGDEPQKVDLDANDWEEQLQNGLVIAAKKPGTY